MTSLYKVSSNTFGAEQQNPPTRVTLITGSHLKKSELRSKAANRSPSHKPHSFPPVMSTTIRFGTSSSPCNPAAAGKALVEETVEREDCDPEKLLQCPFDKNHQIRTCRFPYHLIKCRKNHPKLASELKTCPFNARHLVPKHELMHHTETCVDRISLDTEDGGSTNGHSNWQVPVSTWINPDMSEDWDKEADDAAPPFVWGVKTVMDQKLEARPTNNLGSSFRTPNTLPWSGF